ncbi:MAG: hypothetical protein PHY56_01035 [Candidatus Omnitrophica bacterium]|jgi:hypothetical protein|nr:hypothetical protein [Candidatus Omnitrophota bacterium]
MKHKQHKEFTMKLTSKDSFFAETSGSGRGRTKYGRLYSKIRKMPFNKALIVTLTKYASPSLFKPGGLASTICSNMRYNRIGFKMRCRRISKTKNASKYIIIKLRGRKSK